MAIRTGVIPKSALWMRWIGRAISTLAAGFWLLIALDILACDAMVGFICLSWENLLLLGLTIASLLTVILAWKREELGGIVMVLWGLAFCAIAYVTSQPQQLFSMLVSGVPFLIAGLFFLGSWWLDQGTSNNVIHAA